MIDPGWGAVAATITVAIPGGYLGWRADRAQRARERREAEAEALASTAETRNVALTEMETALKNQRSLIDEIREDAAELRGELDRTAEALSSERRARIEAVREARIRGRIIAAYVRLLTDKMIEAGLEVPEPPEELARDG